MTDDEILAKFTSIRTWKRGDQRAPHKFLLLLDVLARLQRGEPAEARFEDIEPTLAEHLRVFGPPGASGPEHPFWRLQRDGVWSVESGLGGPLLAPEHGNVSARALRESHAIGRLDPAIVAVLRERPSLVNLIAHELLAMQWERSFHEDILDAVGFPWVPEWDRATPTDPGHPRDPDFRRIVLRIYERRCAACGFDARLRDASIAIEAAHVRWWSQSGPDRADNGVALCSLHHRAFDYGAISLDDERRLVVSQDVTGGDVVSRTLVELAGRPILGPIAGEPAVAVEHIRWHRDQVFRAPARR